MLRYYWFLTSSIRLGLISEGVAWLVGFCGRFRSRRTWEGRGERGWLVVQMGSRRGVVFRYIVVVVVV